jgi:serine/threonine protein kinase
VLIDFGLATEFEHPLTSRWRTEPFAPIELNSSEKSRGVYTDVYSLAATLYFLLTGNLPATALARKQGKAHLIPPQKINPRISQRVNHAIIKGMSIESQARPQTVREWLELLGLTVNAPDAEKKVWKWNSIRFWWVLGALVTLLAAIVALITHLKPPSLPSANPTLVATPSTKSR